MAAVAERLVSWFKGYEAVRPFEAFQIEVTSRCNLKCIMCPVTVLADRWPSLDMSWQTFERIGELPADKPSGIFFTHRAHRTGL